MATLGEPPEGRKALNFFHESGKPEPPKNDAVRASEAYERAAVASVEAEKVKLEIEKLKTNRTSGQTSLPPQTDPNCIVTEFATMKDTNVTRTEFLLEPYLASDSPVGFYGRGGTLKSSLVATLAAEISTHASTLWISSEESSDKIKARHVTGIMCEDGSVISQGGEYTLQVVEAVVKSCDAQGRALTTNFNVYEHLEPAIIKAKTNLENVPHQHQPAKPLKLIVLDAIVALTTWGRQAGPNTDEGVKLLFTFLRSLAERHHVTIATIGHSNKGKHEHFADSVMGATAWVNSPRLSFIHGKDMQTEGQVIVRVAKANEIPDFAEIFSSHMVLQLHQFMDGPRAGLMKVFRRDRVWGASAVEQLWENLTTRTKDDFGAPTPAARKNMAIDETITTVLRLLDEGHTAVTRKLVEVTLGRRVNARHWPVIETALAVAHKVLTTTAPHGELVYARK